MDPIEKRLYEYIRNHTDYKVVKFENDFGKPHYFIIPKDADEKTYDYEGQHFFSLSGLMDYVEELKLEIKESKA